MNPITLHIEGQNYVFRYIPGPVGRRYRLVAYPDEYREGSAVDTVQPFYLADTVVRGDDQKSKKMADTEGMSWKDGIAVCVRTSKCSQKNFKSYELYHKAVESNELFIRMPTEFEWEWAALGGEDFIHSGCTNSDEVAWFKSVTEEEHKVRSRKPNGYGLYDMTGYVREWTATWCEALEIRNTGSSRVARGNPSVDHQPEASVLNRLCFPPEAYKHFGVRLCFSANPTVLNLLGRHGLVVG